MTLKTLFSALRKCERDLASDAPFYASDGDIDWYDRKGDQLKRLASKIEAAILKRFEILIQINDELEYQATRRDPSCSTCYEEGAKSLAQFSTRGNGETADAIAEDLFKAWREWATAGRYLR